MSSSSSSSSSGQDTLQVDQITINHEARAMSPFETQRRNVNNVVQPLLTDLYQITMAYAYWKNGRKDAKATFDLFFRKNPFNGEFTVFSGLEEVLLFLQNFMYTHDDVQYLKSVLPATTDEDFFTYLLNLSSKDLTIYSMPEGTVVFPKVPLLRVEGPLPVCQLLETTLLTLINYSSLVATNAARYRLAAGPIELLEFGLRRAQGPDGGLSASRYSYIGGFDATSNVLAGKLYGIPVRGTHAHAFVMSFSSVDDLPVKTLKHRVTKKKVRFVDRCLVHRKKVADLLHVIESEASAGEFAAFVAYAISFPDTFLALIDTYDVVRSLPIDTNVDRLILDRCRSGILNFVAVALGLNDCGYTSVGIRIDSGDLAYLSKVIYKAFHEVEVTLEVEGFSKLKIVASNDINEDTIIALKEEGHHINCYGIGTHLVTCQKQPSLGCVYKLVEIDAHATIKLSLDVSKVTIPGRKVVFRLYGTDGLALVDLMQLSSEEAPNPGDRVLCRHPFQESKRAYVTPTKVELLLEKVWEGERVQEATTLQVIKDNLKESLSSIRSDIKRYLNPTPYKVSVSETLYNHIHTLWLENAPIGELK